MLALAMATITRPRLFLIDELSLRLSQLVVEQLLRRRRGGLARPAPPSLVEQSANVAVAVADRVYVMESGVVTFSGTSAELATHPELLWSIYLRKASESLGRRPAALAAAPNNHDLEVRGISLDFGGNPALDHVSLVATPGRSWGSSVPTAPGRPLSSTSSRVCGSATGQHGGSDST